MTLTDQIAQLWTLSTSPVALPTGCHDCRSR